VGLDVHLDTVGVEHMIGDPFGGEIRDDRVWGRGAVDTKASLAVVVAVLEELRADGRRPLPNVVVSGTVAEEAGGLIGAEAFRHWLNGRGLVLDELLIAEPTDCTPVYGHKGGLGVEVVIEGVAVHSGIPDAGRNAIDSAADVIVAFRDEHRRLIAQPPGALGTATLATTVVSGGAVRNIVPDRCSVYASRRLVEGEDPREVYEQVVAIAERASSLPIHSEYAPGLPAFYGQPDGELCRALAEWSQRTPTVISLGTNAFRYDATVAREMVVFGPGSIAQAHAAEEWCAFSELELAGDVVGRWLTAERP
jgi:acetylornithine deacetylase/succinyl-diaminopimelate desuccinylase-like protein